MDNIFEVFQFDSYAPEPGYTPVRRRDQVQQDVSPLNTASAPWTTIRCNRLLRPLSSRLALLRKRKQHRALPVQSIYRPNNDTFTSTSSQSDSAFEGRKSRLRQERDEDDPEWSPGRAKKRLKRTYSSRGVSQNFRDSDHRKERVHIRQGVDMKDYISMCNLQRQTSAADLVGEELIGSQSGQDDSSSSQQTSTGETSASQMRSSQNSTKESFRRLAKTTSPSEWMLIDGLYIGLDALLKATARRKSPKSTAVRSLFATCLRKVPQYIAMEEHSAVEEDPESTMDISSTIYRDLEEHGCSQSGGWKPLREVVRAHGIAILGSAISDGIISPSIARGLAMLCIQMSAIDEAMDLCDYLLATMNPLAKPKSPSDRLFGPETSVALQTLYDISAESDRWAYFYRSMNTLLQSGMIPIEWVATHGMIECCARMTRSITQRDANVVEAEALLESVMSLVCTQLAAGGLPSINNALTDTISSLITVLLSVDIVRHESAVPIIPQLSKPESITATLASRVAQTCTNTNLNALLRGGYAAQVAQMSIPLLADHLITGRSVPSSCLQVILQGIYTTKNTEVKQRTIDVLASFICATAQCCAQAGSRSAFNYVQDIVASLMLPPGATSSRSVQKVMAELATQAAFEFSEQIDQRVHLDWALEIEEATESLLSSPRNTATSGRTPTREPTKPAAGFRWEEGICEWVAKSPQLLLHQESTTSITHVNPEGSEMISRDLDSSASPSRTSNSADPSIPWPIHKQTTTTTTSSTTTTTTTTTLPRRRGRPRKRPKGLPACGIQILIDRPSQSAHTDALVKQAKTQSPPCIVESNINAILAVESQDPIDHDDELCVGQGKKQGRVVFRELSNPSGFKIQVKVPKGSQRRGGSLPYGGRRSRLGRACASLGGGGGGWESSEDELGM